VIPPRGATICSNRFFVLGVTVFGGDYITYTYAICPLTHGELFLYLVVAHGFVYKFGDRAVALSTLNFPLFYLTIIIIAGAIT
jgi:hypothetical protein